MRSFRPVLQHPVSMGNIKEENKEENDKYVILILPSHEGKEPQKEPIMRERTELGVNLSRTLIDYDCSSQFCERNCSKLRIY